MMLDRYVLNGGVHPPLNLSVSADKNNNSLIDNVIGNHLLHVRGLFTRRGCMVKCSVGYVNSYLFLPDQSLTHYWELNTE